MNLSESDAAYEADQFIDYFSNMGRIDEYLRNVKLDRMSKMPTYLPGCGPEDCLLYTSPSPRDDPLSRMPSSA